MKSDICTGIQGCHRKAGCLHFMRMARFPESNPLTVAAWDDNQLVMTNLILSTNRSATNERAVPGTQANSTA